MTPISALIFTAIGIGLVLGLIVVLVLQIVIGQRVSRITAPLYEYARQQAEQESDRILTEAREKAREVIAEAESAAAALVKEQRADIATHTEAYQRALDELVGSVEHAMKERASAAAGREETIAKEALQAIQTRGAEVQSRLDQIEKALAGLAANSESQAKSVREQILQAGTHAAEELATSFAAAGAENRKLFEERVQSLVTEAHAEVEAYREARKKLIDTNLVDLVIEASRIALGKALTGEEHAALVERALQDAKQNGML